MHAPALIVSRYSDETSLTRGSLHDPCTNVPENRAQNLRFCAELLGYIDRVFSSQQPNQDVKFATIHEAAAFPRDRGAPLISGAIHACSSTREDQSPASMDTRSNGQTGFPTSRDSATLSIRPTHWRESRSVGRTHRARRRHISPKNSVNVLEQFGRNHEKSDIIR